MWRWHRLKSLLGLALFGVVCVCIAYGALTWLFPADGASDSAARVIRAVPLCALLWIFALYVSRLVLHTSDAALVAIAPLSIARYVRRNCLLNSPVVFAAIIVGPVLLVWFVTSASGMTALDRTAWDALSIANLVLLYLAVVLAPTAESVPGTYRAIPWLFVLRIPFRRWFWRASLLLVVGVGANWPSNGAVYRGLTSVVEWILALGPPGYFLLTLLSPLSGAVTQDVISRETQAVLAFVLVVTVLWELRAIVYVFTHDQTQWESGDLDAWLDVRETALAQHDRDISEEELQLENWSSQLVTFESDSNTRAARSSMLGYDSSISPESQVARHAEADARRSRDASTSQVSKATDGNGLMVLLLLFWVGWLGSRTAWQEAHWLGFAALAVVALVNQASGEWWKSRLTLSVSVPVRFPQLVRVAGAHRWKYSVLTASVGAGLFVTSWDQPVWTIIPWVIGLQLLSTAGHAQFWFTIARMSGSRWYEDLWQLTALTAWVGVFGSIALVRTSELWPLPRPLGPWWVPIAAGLSCVIVSIVLARRLHRRSDYSIPLFRSSYSPVNDED